MNDMTIHGGNADITTMTSREIAELTGKEIAHVHRDIRAMLDELKKDDPKLDHPREDKDSRGYTTCFHLNRELTETLLTGYSATARLRVIRRWHELESRPAQQLIPQTLPEALRLAADLAEQKALAEKQRDEAIATKALIGNKREATAMATASAAKREANKLAIELDKSKEYATVKRMELLYHGQKFNWRLLKNAANEMNMPPIDVFDQNYGTVKAYHADVWRESYAIEIEPIHKEAA